MEFTNFKRELQTLNYAELNYLISDIMLEIKKRSYNEGMVKAMTSFESGSVGKLELPENTPPFVPPLPNIKSPQQLRDEIVEKAKRDVAELKNTHGGGTYYHVEDSADPRNPWCCTEDFIVNRQKRTVVVLMRGYNHSQNIYAKGIAKCDPSDCFNVHIGKAIALRRALGLEVLTEYLNAPQPTEVRVGDVVEHSWVGRENPDIELAEVIAIEDGDKVRYDDGQFDYISVINRVDSDGQSVRVSDDSRVNNEVGVTEQWRD